MKNKIVNFYKIKFYNCPSVELFNKLVKKKKAYLVAPAASSLSQIVADRQHLIALQKSTVAIFDSGFFCILLLILKGIIIKKNSGFFFLKYLLSIDSIKKSKLLLIDPTKRTSLINKKFLRINKFTKLKSYIAPIYNPIDVKDLKLIQLIDLYKPKYILLNIGGGIQEKLAFFINKNSKNNQIIFCLGAAIGFYTGDQAPINNFFDKIYAGWLIRVLYNPIVFLPRVFKSIYLIKLFLKKEAFK
jgi:UDP-N-acetyl-D-mannosaminuronic acid transferase (WecB/TagA/CpsF family)